MDTNLRGRLRNTPLPYSRGLMPLFEAVVNSIHAIEETGYSSNRGKIIVDILRDSHPNSSLFPNQKKPGPDATEDIIGFKITDNGIGFNDANMKSFETLDSEYKADKGCRGVGRLLWLKAFNKIRVTSIFKDDTGCLKSRSFTFNTSGVSTPVTSDAPDKSAVQTSVHLEGFNKRYRDSSKKTTSAIANSLFEHCLWYFVRQGGAPEILIADTDETVHLDQVYDEHMLSSASTESISIKNREFDLTHVKLRSNSSQSHVIAFCAANRLVKEENISGKIPGLYGKIRDNNSEFVYACYVSSEFLDEKVRAERTGFEIDDDIEGLFAQTEISLNDIKSAIIERICLFLSDYLAESKKAGRERLDSFVAKKAPRYRPILARIPEDKLIVDPNISDKELDLVLHKHLSEIEGKLLSDGHTIMNPKHDEELVDYQKRLQEYLKTAEDIKKSDLANYVSHRKVILDLLGKAIEKGDDGKYAREDLIHGLIMPMRKDSDEIMFDGYNLWLLDERLAFHDYLASDRPLSSIPITGSNQTKEPDICALNVFDKPILVSEGTKLPLASIVVVEIKRPMRNDAKVGEDHDPIEQALGYLDRIREGNVQTASGRPIPRSEDIPGYCYVICDITKSIRNRCKMHSLTVTSDHMGYFGYNPNFKAYVEVISFDRLVNAAKERNRAFFDKLGLPTT
jgi:hypothetical protein